MCQLYSVFTAKTFDFKFPVRLKLWRASGHSGLQTALSPAQQVGSSILICHNDVVWQLQFFDYYFRYKQSLLSS